MKKTFLLIFISMAISIFAQKGGKQMEEFQIYSTAFKNGEEIPALYTCQGKNISPPLFWKGIPEGTKSLALIADDPDAPDPAAPRITWVHWVLYNIPVEAKELQEGTDSANLPAGTEEGLNSWNKTGYGGPCPPIGRHRYFFKLYALKEKLEGLHHPTKNELLKAMEGKIIAKTELMGTYIKK